MKMWCNGITLWKGTPREKKEKGICQIKIKTWTLLVGGLPAGPTLVLGVQKPSPDPQNPNLSARPCKISFVFGDLHRTDKQMLGTLDIQHSEQTIGKTTQSSKVFKYSKYLN